MKIRFRLLPALFVALWSFSLLLSCFGSARRTVPANAEPVSRDVSGARVTRVLLLGVDRAAGLTDSVMIAAVNETAKNVTLLQIPRDTYASYTERDYRKLNGAWKTLGAEGLKRFLSDALGVQIRYYAVTDLSLFRDLVDAVGGVEVDVPREMNYSDPAQGLEIRLPAGKTRLDGELAEEFVRFRSGYANADLGRLDAQKVFLRAFAEKCRALTPTETWGVLRVALRGLATDLDLPAILRLKTVFDACGEIRMETLPGQAVQGTSGAWYYAVNRAGGARIVRELLFPDASFTDADFDPNEVFDRREHELFHAVYTVPEAGLPVTDLPEQRKENRWKNKTT